MLNQENRKIGKYKIIYGLIFFIGLAIFIASIIPKNYIQPDQQFLSSIIRFGPYGQYGEVEISTFVTLLENVEMDNGENPKILGWTKEDNQYTLHVIMKKPVNFTITHLLQSDYGGKLSVMEPIGSDNVSPDTFFLQLVSGIPEKTMGKINTENYLKNNPVKTGFCLVDTKVHESAFPQSRIFTTLKKGQEVSITSEVVSVVSGTCGNDCGEDVWLEIVFLDTNQEFLLDSEYKLRRFYVKKNDIGFFDN